MLRLTLTRSLSIRILGLLVCLYISLNGPAQNLIGALPGEDFDNIKVQKLSSDDRASSFLIWVKKEVKAHWHELHTENLYVIDGTGDMTVGEKEFQLKPGDHITIPMNVVHSVKVTSQTPLKVLSIQAPEFLGKDRIYVSE